METQNPSIDKPSFRCPHCNTYSLMDWFWLKPQSLTKHEVLTDARMASCHCCGKRSYWLATVVDGKSHDIQKIACNGVMLFPDAGVAPTPAEDMPEDVKKDYLEASTIHSRSLRASAALLRLALQKLMVHLGQKGKNINQDIRALSAEDKLPLSIIKLADTVRLTGNNAVHPGVMSEMDFDNVASQMFQLINLIVRKAITEPREIEELYLATPEKARIAAEKEDSKAKQKDAK